MLKMDISASPLLLPRLPLFTGKPLGATVKASIKSTINRLIYFIVYYVNQHYSLGGGGGGKLKIHFL